jgi:hypothetical protein
VIAHGQAAKKKQNDIKKKKGRNDWRSWGATFSMRPKNNGKESARITP